MKNGRSRKNNLASEVFKGGRRSVGVGGWVGWDGKGVFFKRKVNGTKRVKNERRVKGVKNIATLKINDLKYANGNVK